MVVLPTGYGLIMANIKIFQLLPDVYDMLLGVTNSIVMQDRVAKLNDKGISACMIQTEKFFVCAGNISFLKNFARRIAAELVIT